MRHWLHVGLVELGGQKMSKSLGNLVFVSDLLKDWEPAALRLALLAHHYRHDWEWTGADMPGAAARLERWRRSLAGAVGRRGTGASSGEPLAAVRERLDDDLDTPGALQALDEWAAAGGAIGAGAALLGVDL